VFGVSQSDVMFPVKVEIAKVSGRCLVVQKRDCFLLVDEADEQFRLKTNPIAFKVMFNAAVVNCFFYERLVVLPLELRSVRIDGSAIFASVNGFPIVIRPIAGDDQVFVDALAATSEGKAAADVSSGKGKAAKGG